LGAIHDAEDVLSHPFFADLDIKKLQSKLLQAPFVPKIPDLEKLRSMNKELAFKDFQETIIPSQKMELVNNKNEEFEIFGEVREIDTHQ
jgi:hypothetical protein